MTCRWYTGMKECFVSGPAEEGGECLAAYLTRRCVTSIVILFGISIFTFVLLHLVYPSPAIIVLGPRASPAAINAWNAQNGFDEPVIVQFWQYMYAVLHGNLGYSYKLNQSVAMLFGERWGFSAYLSGSALTLAILIAIPLGIFQAVRRNTFGDGVVTSVAFTAYAMPDYLLYLIAIQIFALSFFNYNGLGLLFYDSLSNADYPVLLAYTLIGAVLTVTGNLVADVALTVADPRIRLA